MKENIPKTKIMGDEGGPQAPMTQGAHDPTSSKESPTSSFNT